MKTFEITLVISHAESDDEKLISSLFESGCDDFTLSIQRGARILDFDREALTFADALTSACKSVTAVGGRVIRIEPDNLVTMSDVAKRLDRSRSAVSQYVAGTRRERFPAPVVRVTAENPLWDWVQVLEWLAREGDTAATEQALSQARAIKRASLPNTQQNQHVFATEVVAFVANTNAIGIGGAKEIASPHFGMWNAAELKIVSQSLFEVG